MYLNISIFICVFVCICLCVCVREKERARKNTYMFVLVFNACRGVVRVMRVCMRVSGCACVCLYVYVCCVFVRECERVRVYAIKEGKGPLHYFCLGALNEQFSP